MKRWTGAIVLLMTAAIPSIGSGEPSDTCVSGLVPPSFTPAGAGVRLSTEPGKATVTACNKGTVAPLPGSARATVDVGSPDVLVVWDGDTTANALPCTDGYAAARLRGDGPFLYQNGDGGFTTRARAKSPDEFAGDAAEDCTEGMPPAA